MPLCGAQPRQGDSSAGKDPRALASLFVMGMRRRLGFLLAAVLGAAVVVLPAIAASETAPTITAENFGGGIYKEETHAWMPSQVTITQGGTVTLSNPTEVKHGVEWISPPATPTCDSGVPVGNTEAASNTKWSGTCTFTTPGVYVFYCTVHHAAMTGRVTVAANGTTTTTTTRTPTTTTTTTTATTPGESGASATGAPGSPLAGSAVNAVKLPFSQHGKSVRGSVAVSAAGAGGRLEVDLLARRASLASVGHPPPVRVGKTVHTSLPAGRVPFSVPLTTRARNALRRRGRLALSVKVIVRPASGAGVTITRSVVVHS
jgi:plastocyanin